MRAANIEIHTLFMKTLHHFSIIFIIIIIMIICLLMYNLLLHIYTKLTLFVIAGSHARHAAVAAMTLLVL